MGNLAIPGPLVKPLPRPVQIYADIYIYIGYEDLYRKIATELWVIWLYQVHLYHPSRVQSKFMPIYGYIGYKSNFTEKWLRNYG